MYLTVFGLFYSLWCSVITGRYMIGLLEPRG